MQLGDPHDEVRPLTVTHCESVQYWAPLVAKPGTADAATQAGGLAGAQGLATSAAAAAAAGSQRSPTFRPPMPANPKPPGQVHPLTFCLF